MDRHSEILKKKNKTIKNVIYIFLNLNSYYSESIHMTEMTESVPLRRTSDTLAVSCLLSICTVYTVTAANGRPWLIAFQDGESRSCVCLWDGSWIYTPPLTYKATRLIAEEYSLKQSDHWRQWLYRISISNKRSLSSVSAGLNIA